MLVAISGPSSAGKSTLTRLLKQVFENTTIIYEDDFYRDDKDIPVAANGLADWDSPEAFDLAQLDKVLKQVRSTGQLPPDFESKEEKNELGPTNVTADQLAEVKAKVKARSAQGLKLVIVDGILLFHEASPLSQDFDHRLFLRAPYDLLKQRRENRKGYLTLQDFWVDPPGYFDDIVWPGYVRAHKYLFVDGNVDGDLDWEVVKSQQIEAPVKSDLPMADLLNWAVDVLMDNIQ